MTKDLVLSENICRICLKEKKEMLSIFIPTNDEFEEKIPKKIMLCANVEISDADGLPSRICTSCLENLNVAFAFRILCEASDATLKNIMLNHKDNTSINQTIKEEDVTKEIFPQNTFELNLKEESQDLKLGSSPNLENSESIDQDRLAEILVNGSVTTESDTDNLPISVVDAIIQTSTKGNKKLRIKKKKKVRKGRKLKEKSNGEEKRTCGVCLRVFNCKMDLYDHERLQNHHAKYPCITCGKKYSRNYLMIHAASHSTKLIQCNICKRSFSHKYKLNAHVRRAHNKIELECSACGRLFNRRFDLIVHLRKHNNERPFVCETCGKAFYRKDKLLKHRQIHDGIKNFMCDICGRSFRQQPHLKEHVYIHMGIKPFECKLCNSAFTQKHCLKTHILMKHKQINETIS